MTTAFQSNAFQHNAFQIDTTPIVNDTTGRGSYSYVFPFQKEQLQAEKVIKEKTELQKLESVLTETNRLKGLAHESLVLAQQRKARKRALELAQKEKEYLTEINRLLIVRVELMQRIKESEEILMVMIAMRRRLRVGNWQVN